MTRPHRRPAVDERRGAGFWLGGDLVGMGPNLVIVCGYGMRQQHRPRLSFIKGIISRNPRLYPSKFATALNRADRYSQHCWRPQAPYWTFLCVLVFASTL